MAYYKPGEKVLGYLRYEARARADRLIHGAPITRTAIDPYAGQNITTPELDGYINNSLMELYDELIASWNSYWKVSHYTFNTVQNQDEYILPADFYKHILTEWRQQAGTNNLNFTLPKLNMKEQNKYTQAVFATSAIIFGQGTAWYQIEGGNIQLRPIPQGGYEMRMHYVPVPPPLVDYATITMNSTVAGDVLNFLVTASGQTYTNAVFTAVAHGQAQTATHFVLGGTGSDLGDTGTATSLAAVLTSNFGGTGGTITASSSGTKVTICLVQPASVTWSFTPAVLQNSMVLDPLIGTGSAGNVFVLSNVQNFYSSIDEYVVIDAAIKICQKQNRMEEVSVLMPQKIAQLSRIKSKYCVRDPGAPRTMTDVTNWGGFGSPYGYGGW